MNCFVVTQVKETIEVREYRDENAKAVFCGGSLYGSLRNGADNIYFIGKFENTNYAINHYMKLFNEMFQERHKEGLEED